jgi:putative phage-type endonuclease
MPVTVREAKTIGGSEIAVVMGLSRFKTPLRLWAEKTGRIVTEDISEREYIQLGTELEDFVARKFSKMTGLPVRRDTRTFRHAKYPYMVAHIDRRITGTDELLECKTCNAWKAKEWEGEDIPQEYILQVMWYLGLLGMSKGYIAVLIGGQKFVHKEIQFDQELFDKMVEAAKTFIEYNVAEEVAPIAISGDSSTLLRMYPEQAEKIIIQRPDKDTDELVNEIQALKRVIDSAETEKEEKEAKLKQIIGDTEGVDTLTYKVTWKAQGATKLDTPKLKADGLYDKYAIKYSKRVMSVNKKKEITHDNK